MREYKEFSPLSLQKRFIYKEERNIIFINQLSKYYGNIFNGKQLGKTIKKTEFS